MPILCMYSIPSMWEQEGGPSSFITPPGQKIDVNQPHEVLCLSIYLSIYLSRYDCQAPLTESWLLHSDTGGGGYIHTSVTSVMMSFQIAIMPKKEWCRWTDGNSRMSIRQHHYHILLLLDSDACSAISIYSSPPYVWYYVLLTHPWTCPHSVVGGSWQYLWGTCTQSLRYLPHHLPRTPARIMTPQHATVIDDNERWMEQGRRPPLYLRGQTHYWIMTIKPRFSQTNKGISRDTCFHNNHLVPVGPT